MTIIDKDTMIEDFKTTAYDRQLWQKGLVSRDNQFGQDLDNFKNIVLGISEEVKYAKEKR